MPDFIDRSSNVDSQSGVMPDIPYHADIPYYVDIPYHADIPYVVFQFSNKASASSWEPTILALTIEESNRAVFEYMSSDWLSDTQWVSSISTITRHPRFAAIKQIGPSVIKFVLEHLAKGDLQPHWFPLLKDISGQDPVPPQSRGRISEMAREWMAWGKANRYT